ncbi:MAG: Mu transposase C-terminal domain-containing protein [Pseudomonadota bacterium]
MTEVWHSASEWAEHAKKLGVPNKVLPHTKAGIIGRAKKDCWPSKPREESGGGQEYPLSALPAAFRKAWSKRFLQTQAPAVPAPLADLPAVEDLKSYQTTTLEARAVLLAEIDRLVMMGSTQTAAIEALVEAAKNGELPPELQRLVPIANARSGEGRALSDRSVKRWLSIRKQAGGKVVALAPKAVPEAPIPVWAQTFLRLFGRSSNPGIAEVLDDYWPAGEPKPSYDQAKRFLKRLDAVSRNRGRMGPRALQQLKAYVSRDVSELWPGAVFIGDGHTHKRLIAHPIHGGPFRPEVTAILDVYSRVWVGWSAALAENTWAVADALRHAVTNATCCDIFYYDNGSGAKNKTWDDDCTGLMARLGFTKLHSAPWGSQARGVVERFHSSVLHRVARRGASYVGPRMDKEARQRAYKVIEADVKAAGTSKLLPTWSEFIAEIDAEMERYNDRPHSTLPKIIDPETGKRRHMTPNEMWNRAIAEGWQPDPIPAEEARTLFRPAVRRKVRRALVEWIGNEYFAPELEYLHGEDVVVAYDLHDARSVEISLPDGRWVCTAVWGGHKQSYVPVAFAQQAHEQRIAGRLARNDARRDRIMAEAGPRMLEHQPAQTMPTIEPTVEELRIAEAEFARLERASQEAPLSMAAEPATGQRPTFSDDISWARWVSENPHLAMEDDRRELRRKLRDRSFQMLLEMQGLDVGALSALAA